MAGHSAGGQYVQRWALLSGVQPRRLDVRTVVANPRSFCFLDDRRFVNGTFRVPPVDLVAACPDYNAWEWGLDNTANRLPTPYKDRAIVAAGGTDAVVQRYQTRQVVCLAGELDLDESGNCRAMFQGKSRRERSQHFMASLRYIYGRPAHHRLVVHGVHHDHCLMFQSPEGRQALFGLK